MYNCRVPQPLERGLVCLQMRKRYSIPRVLLLVETSRAYGRGILEGIARYARERGSWSIRFEDRGLEPMPCNWLKGWRGDGIISRTVDPSLARALRATRLPIVELHGDRRIGTARVTCDDDEMGRLAVEHLLACGLHDFAVFSYGETWWTRSHCDGFVRALRTGATSAICIDRRRRLANGPCPSGMIVNCPA